MEEDRSRKDAEREADTPAGWLRWSGEVLPAATASLRSQIPAASPLCGCHPLQFCAVPKSAYEMGSVMGSDA